MGLKRKKQDKNAGLQRASASWSLCPPGISTVEGNERERVANELRQSFDGYLKIFTLHIERELRFDNRHDAETARTIAPSIAEEWAIEAWDFDTMHGKTLNFDNAFGSVYSQYLERRNEIINPEGNQ